MQTYHPVRITPQEPFESFKPKLSHLGGHNIALRQPRRDYYLYYAPKVNAASGCPNEDPCIPLNQGALKYLTPVPQAQERAN